MSRIRTTFGLLCLALTIVLAGCSALPRFFKGAAYRQAKKEHRSVAVLPFRVSYGAEAPQTHADSLLMRLQSAAHSELAQARTCLYLQKFLFTAKFQDFNVTNTRLRANGLSASAFAEGVGLNRLGQMPEVLGVDAVLYGHLHLRGEAARAKDPDGQPKGSFTTESFDDFDFVVQFYDDSGRPFWTYSWDKSKQFDQALGLLAFMLPYKPSRKQVKQYEKDGTLPYAAERQPGG